MLKKKVIKMNLKNYQFRLNIIKLLKQEMSDNWRIKICQKIIFTYHNQGGEVTTEIAKSLIFDNLKNLISS